MDYNKWLNHTFSSGTTAGQDYIDFQRAMRIDLKKQAEKNNLELYSFNKNHYEFSAVLKEKETGAFAYVSISDVRFFKNEWYKNVLIRTMSHDKDWTGGSNNRCMWNEVGNKVKSLLDRSNNIQNIELDYEIER